MKNFKIKSSSLIISLILILAVSVGVTYAYFTDYDQLAGAATLSLNGATEVEEEVQDLTKTISIENRGEEGKNASCVVKLLIYGPEGMTVSLDNASDWTKLETEEGVYEYYYNHILAPGKTTSNVVASIEDVPADADMADLEIIVLHESKAVVFDEDGKVIAPQGWVDFPEIKE